MSPYYEDATTTIYCGDNQEVLASLRPGPEADLIFTSPPYNLGVSTGGGMAAHSKSKAAAWSKNSRWSGAALADGYDGHDDAMPLPEYEEWQRNVLMACWAALSDVGAIFYNHKPRVQDCELWLPLRLNPGLPLRQIVTWARDGGVNFNPTAYLPTYEWLMVFAKPDWRLRSKGASGVGDVWNARQGAGTKHPAPFPLSLPARAIETCAPNLVLDPFMGSGTTLVAAKAAGVRAIGIEKSERYCEMAVKRLSQGVLDWGDA